MKTLPFLALLAASSVQGEVREWTSADGSKTFQAQVTAYNQVNRTATMDVDGHILNFKASSLSEADRSFLENWEAQPAKSTDPTSLPDLLAKDQLMRLKDEKFAPIALTPAPSHLLLYFSASWCAPCVAGAPELVENYRKFIASNDSLELVHLSQDNTAAAATEWAVRESFPWPTILPSNSKDGLQRFYPNEGVPEFVLIDAEGQVVLVGPSEVVFSKLKQLYPIPATKEPIPPEKENNSEAEDAPKPN